jgi:MYXO-CTERM domain-containing protein
MRRWTLATLIALLAVPTHAQRTVAYDTVSDGFPAAVTCGFCAGEKFGVVFYELPGGTGLRADEFPLTLTAIQIAVARIRVTGDVFGRVCSGSNMAGTVDLTLEVFAGESVPTAVRNLPASGAWPGERMVLTTDTTVTVSVATTDGGSEFNVTLNEIPIPDGGVLVEAPAAYLRVVASVPGGGSSTSCTDLGFTSPGAVAIRDDDGRVAPRRSLIYALPIELGGLGGIPGGWYWNEEVPPEEDGAPPGIAGDWALRISVSPSGAPPVDAGPTPARDAGTSDGGPIMSDDAGSSADASIPFDGGTSGCTMDSQCGGGERCIDGGCVRTTCTTTDECGGGRSCVDGRCRNLCDTDRDCEGGEVCGATEGVCRPADSSGGDGGCSCGAPGAGASSPAPFVSLAVGLAWLARRRRR